VFAGPWCGVSTGLHVYCCTQGGCVPLRVDSHSAIYRIKCLCAPCCVVGIWLWCCYQGASPVLLYCRVATSCFIGFLHPVRSNTIDIHCSRTCLWCWLRFQELPSVPFVKKQGTLLMAMMHRHCPHHTVQFHPEEFGYRSMVNRFLRTSAKSLRHIASSNLGSLQKRLQSKIQSKKWQLHRFIWL
jgi:hypothetical protein